ncbi:chemotaxis response regulator protein-glutamate methylesterase [uncultured Maritimibacter sp.]|jgi:two-component system chemotaxis response regulator CheB|uniref:protein-glutamate methylesterase/protein-glutamine glutaminase n=1 Tax=uncultured Maritimibacter sp. TaxID=991866 RepID=UPI000B0FA476|nr:chemotaxis response regulator protein-glutamate methylesterase [uncultured Maritimibacter sp.]
MKDKINVMVVDDSPSVRALLTSFIRQDPGLELCGTAQDPFEAAEKIRDRLPDVLLLDLHMPRMDGLTFLKKIMSQRPLPVIVISSLAREGSETTLKALELGAADVLLKPQISSQRDRQEAAIRISDCIRAAVQTGTRRHRKTVAMAPGEKHTADVILPRATGGPPRMQPRFIALGASTGGTEALRTVFEELPADLPPIAVVQHMPQGFTTAFANRLNTTSAVEIFEAEDGRIIQPGQAAIAQGNRHLTIHRDASGYRIRLRDGPCVSRHRPSVDVLFRSVAQTVGGSALGAILTGMGDDGAAGLLELREAGAYTLAQDEATSVVFGMPRVAIDLGAAHRILPLGRIAGEIVNWNASQRQIAS